MSKYVVVRIASTCDFLNKVVEFPTKQKAIAYLSYIWEKDYNSMLSAGIQIDEELSYHEKCLARIYESNEVYTEYNVIEIESEDYEFEASDWKRYL